MITLSLSCLILNLSTYLRDAFKNDVFKIINDGQKHFFDCGENFEYMRCSICDANMDSNWWGEQMDNTYKNNFDDLNVVTDCCGSKASLNELNYSWDEGFARFAVQTESSMFSDENILRKIDSLIGAKTKLIITRY